MKIAILKLIEEYKDIFAVELSATSIASLPAMTLTVDSNKWKSKSNSLPPRPQSLAKEAEIIKQTSHLRNINRIVECSEPYYSQIHLANKPYN